MSIFSVEMPYLLLFRRLVSGKLGSGDTTNPPFASQSTLRQVDPSNTSRGAFDISPYPYARCISARFIWLLPVLANIMQDL